LRLVDEDQDNTATQAKSVNDEAENTAIAVSLPAATNAKSPALGRRKQKRQLWEYEPAVDSVSKYWDVGVEGKRTRTLNKASYSEEDRRTNDLIPTMTLRIYSNLKGRRSRPPKVTMNILQRN
jgi:hypothetical protein